MPTEAITEQLKQDMRELDNLRDQFARAALTGILANEQTKVDAFSFEPDYIARQAYRLANEMMNARK